jgi:hypothetical protein
MKPVVQIAIPHEDILKGRLSLEVFAADLWQVAKGKAPAEYQDPDLFFRRTFITKGLKNLLEVAEKRLRGESGDAVIQLQTPFGGGKTHAMIALFHKAKEWGAKVAVFDGTALNPNESRPWEEIERQLSGKIEITKGLIAPGKEKLIKILSDNSPALILMDEILEFITKAAGIKVGDSNLAAQTLAFIQELTGAVSAVGNAMLVLTLPSSLLERYDENAEKAFQQLQKIAGRMEKIYTPVEDDEIELVVRKRLFSSINEREAKEVVDEFVEHAKTEGLLKEDAEVYRQKFIRSYPFKPEVIEVLYRRWGSFPTFQRTRGVLRLLALVIYRLMQKNLPFIRICDFDLKADEIRRELIKHIGQEWDSIIAQDITADNSGAKKVDKSLPASYAPYNLGTAVSTAIFMMSFSGRGERGCSIRELKLGTLLPGISSSIIDTVIADLRENLFYLADEELYFTNQPNLNRVIVLREESLDERKIYEEELNLIEKSNKGGKFKVYIHPKYPKDIPDTEELKLVIMDTPKPRKEFLTEHGDSPRVYRNVLIFLCPEEIQKSHFYDFLRKKLALASIKADKTLKLTEAQKNKLNEMLKNLENKEYEELRRYYRKIFLPAKDDFKLLDMGMPSYGEKKLLDREVYDFLKGKEEILESLHSAVILERYLAKKDYIKILDIYESLVKTPGELRLASREGFIRSIVDGVRGGIFGFGHLGADLEPEPECINCTPEIKLAEDEIIIKPDLFKREEQKKEETEKKEAEKIEKIEKEIVRETKETKETKVEEGPAGKKYRSLYLRLQIPLGKFSDVGKLSQYLSQKFNNIQIELSIKASEGEITEQEYEDRVIEALNQAKFRLLEERKD